MRKGVVGCSSQGIARRMQRKGQQMRSHAAGGAGAQHSHQRLPAAAPAASGPPGSQPGGRAACAQQAVQHGRGPRRGEWEQLRRSRGTATQDTTNSAEAWQQHKTRGGNWWSQQQGCSRRCCWGRRPAAGGCRPPACCAATACCRQGVSWQRRLRKAVDAHRHHAAANSGVVHRVHRQLCCFLGWEAHDAKAAAQGAEGTGRAGQG